MEDGKGRSNLQEVSSGNPMILAMFVGRAEEDHLSFIAQNAATSHTGFLVYLSKSVHIDIW